MNLSNLISLMSNANNHILEFVLSYTAIAIMILIIVFIILVNKKVLLKNSNNRLKRIITHPLFVYSLNVIKR